MTQELDIRSENIEEFYDIGEEIGSGQFAVVKKILEKSSGQNFAAKYMKKKRVKSLRRGMTSEQILREANVLRSVNHKGIIYLHDIFETKLEFILVLELLSGGELFEFLSEQEYLTEDEAVGFLKQVIEAIDYLHQKSIVHLDIKPENIVLKTEGSSQIKLIDFGLARKLSKGEMVREIMGTPEFVAPEIIAFEPVGTETDMWAIGVLTYIMLSGASPFLGDNDNETFNNISHVDYEFDDEYFKDISSPAKEFISDLLLKNPRERMTAEECLGHEWMQEQHSSCESEEDDNIDSLPADKTGPPKTEARTRRSTLIKTEAFKKFTARARWQKSVNKLIAISRLALLGKKNGPLAKGVMLQPNESDTSSDTETNNEPQLIPHARPNDSDRKSTPESTNEEELKDSTKTGNERENEETTISWENGDENGRKSHENEEEESLSDVFDTQKPNNEVAVAKSWSGSERKKNLRRESSGVRESKKTLNDKKSEKVEASEFHRMEKVEKSLKTGQEIPDLPEKKPVLPEDKPALLDDKPVSPQKKSLPSEKSPIDATFDVEIKESVWKPKPEVVSEKRLPQKNTQRIPQTKSKENEVITERKQEDSKPKSKFLFHDENKGDKSAKKTDPAKMRTGRFESLLSKFSKLSGASEEESKKNKYGKEARRMSSGAVRNKTKNEEFQETRTRRKSDQMTSRIDWKGIRGEVDERVKHELRNTQPTEGLPRSSPAYAENSKVLTQNMAVPTDTTERSKSPALEKRSATERTFSTSVPRTEIRKTVSSKPSDDRAVKHDDSIWVRRSTTSRIEGTRKEFRSTRRGMLGLSHTSAKAEVMKWEQRSNSVDSSPKRPTSSPLRSVTDRPLVKGRYKEETPVHNTTVTVNTKDTRKVPSGEVGIGDTAVKDQEHILLVQASLPLEKSKNLESQLRSEVVKNREESSAEVKTEERKVERRASEKTDASKPLVESEGRYNRVVENPDNRPNQKTENSSSRPKRENGRSEIQAKIQSGNASVFPEFALTFQRVLPNGNGDLAGDNDDFVWVMTSEENPNLQLLSGVVDPKANVSTQSEESRQRKTTKSSEAEIEPTEQVDSGRRRRSTKTSEAETEPTERVASRRRRRKTKTSEAEAEPTEQVDSGRRRRSTKTSKAETEPSERVDSGRRKRSTKSSEAGTEYTVRVTSGDTETCKIISSTKLVDKSSEASSHINTIPLKPAVTTINFEINSGGFKLK